MKRLKKTQAFARTLVIAVAMTTTLAACSSVEESKPMQAAPEIMEPQKEFEGPKETNVPTEQTTDEAQSLEKISAEDAKKYMDALKKEDAEALSILMAHAENEYVPETMKTVIEGFQLHFDKLADLKLTFESNQQTEDYFIEKFVISGMREGKERFVPFLVKYSKENGISAIQNENYREPLFDSPLIGQYPYMVLNAGKYVQALLQKDSESLALHLGLDVTTEEANSVIQQMLKAYSGKLDLATTKVIPLGYDENRELFLFDLRDGNKQSHGIQVDVATSNILDDWASADK